ncbi:MAG: hypothetical protein QW175_04645 [Candidatus Bathyarchaeia archaeon]
MRAILVAPKFDDATSYSYEWSREVKQLLQERGYDVVDIGGKPLSRGEVEEALKKNPNALFIFYNHGNMDCLWASNEEKAVDLKNVELFSNREVFTMACLSASKLGVEAYRKNCKAYWGYRVVFAFTTDAIEEFNEFANCGIKFRLDGKEWSECLKLAKELAEQLAKKLTKEGKCFSAVFMKENAEGLVCYDAHPPEPRCPLRKLAVKLFGEKIGWRLSRRHAVSFFLFGFGLGIVIHDFFVECADPLRLPPHGFWYGVMFILVAFVMFILNANTFKE